MKFHFVIAGILISGSLLAQVQIDKPIQLTGTGSNAQISGIQYISTPTDATSVESLQKGSFISGAATGSGNNFLLTLSPAIAAYQMGMTFTFLSNQTITGACTLNVNSLGAVPINKLVNQPLASCEIQTGQLVTVAFDGTNFQITSLLSYPPQPPTVGSNSPVCAGSNINLTSSSGLVGASYSWTGPNGWTSSAQNPVITSAQTNQAGTYSVTVTSNGCSSSATSALVVVNASPSSAFTFSPASPFINQSVTFSPSLTGASYSWTFPGGTPPSSSVQNPSVSWSANNTYTISLTVTSSGCSSTTSNPIVISASPSSPTYVCQPGDNVTAGATTGFLGCVTFSYGGSTVTYTTVRSADGKEWLRQNLGASQVATSATDANGYGDLFQWGRWVDGHQVRTPANLSNTMPSPNSPAGISFAGPNPFYHSSPYWWAGGTTSDTWTGTVSGDKSATNGIDPCKQSLGGGWRLPTFAEWQTMVAAEGITGAATAYSGRLKLTQAGYRDATGGGSIASQGTAAQYWASTANAGSGTSGTSYYIDNSGAYPSGGARTHGGSLRCLK